MFKPIDKQRESFSKMRILLLGEYCHVHATLAKGLRALGHEVTVVSNGDFWKNYPRDIDVARTPGKIGGIRLYLKILSLLPKLTGYDIVQLINPMFFELRAERMFFFYHFLKKHNKHVVLGAFGMDYYWVKTCTFDKPLRYSDFNIGDRVRTDAPAVREQRDWLGTTKERLNKEIASSCDAIVTGLYEYDVCYRPVFPDKTKYIPFPIQIQNQDPLIQNSKFKIQNYDYQVDTGSSDSGNQTSSPWGRLGGERQLKLFIGISKGRSTYKGTDIMLAAAKAVKEKYPDNLELRVAEGVPFDEYQRMINGSDALMDQLYSYTPGMNALLAMSKGIIVIGGGEPENYEIIHEDKLRPIVNVQPTFDSVYYELERLVLNPSIIPELKRQSIEYVRKHHDYIKVAKEYEQLYSGLLNFLSTL